uniref:Cyclin-like domain-containing protein n=1 Tax=Arcella intermedia TaxID=1963864 RepID=A0A6B2LDN1_9EUKA
MSANFWESTHKQWLKSRSEVEGQYSKDHLTLLELKKVHIFYVHLMVRVGGLVGLRQRVISTAVVYWKRFYMRYTLLEKDPVLVGITALYLASKVEECNSKVDTILDKLKAAEKDYGNRFKFPEYTNLDVIHNEFYLMHGLKCQLLIYHPYKDLENFLTTSNLLEIKEESWKFLNDTYKSNVCLSYPPYVIALACIYLCGFVAKDGRVVKRITKWFLELNADMNQVGEVVKDMMELYELWGTDENCFLGEIVDILQKKLSIPTATDTAPGNIVRHTNIL